MRCRPEQPLCCCLVRARLVDLALRREQPKGVDRISGMSTGKSGNIRASRRDDFSTVGLSSLPSTVFFPDLSYLPHIAGRENSRLSSLRLEAGIQP